MQTGLFHFCPDVAPITAGWDNEDPSDGLSKRGTRYEWKCKAAGISAEVY